MIWGGLGDLSETGGDRRLLAAPDLSRTAEIAMALLGTAVVLAILSRLWHSRESLRKEVREIVGFSLLSGFLLAVGCRIVTARAVGANIGAGLIVMIAPFVAVALLVVVVRLWLRL